MLLKIKFAKNGDKILVLKNKYLILRFGILTYIINNLIKQK